MKKYLTLLAAFAASAAFLIAGLAQGQAGQVLLKATKICMECIGIG